MVNNAPERIAGYAVYATIAIAIPAIGIVVPYLRSQKSSILVASAIVGVLVPGGTYRGVSKFLRYTFRRSLWVRRWLLGRTFLEGTWVGHYERDGNHIVTIEFYNQEGEEIRIEGEEIDMTTTPHNTLSKWISNAASLDDVADTVFYGYSRYPFTQSSPNEGIARFWLVLNSNGSKPHELNGYYVDLPDCRNVGNYLYKIDDKRTEGMKNKEKTLAEARKKFNIPEPRTDGS